MCGIAGEVSYSCNLKHRENAFLKMQKVLSPRGPDQSGIYIGEHAALVHTRLAVIDVENGKQPMEFQKDENRYILVYNGELYNTNEVRQALISLGYTFIGHSDTEVVLKAYAAWGEACVHHFNGIFAFAVWDTARETLFAARDRIGVKPFFYALQNDSFLFASEIKGILAHGALQPEIDLSSIAEIMFIGPGRTPGCGVFKGIAELKPAHCLTYSKDGAKIKRYWKLKDRLHRDSFKTTAETVRYLVTDAIERQLVSDVPVCTFLSGGLDSSIISTIADNYMQQKGERLHTFSLDYKDNARYFQSSRFQPNSDPEFIEAMCGVLSAEHHWIVLDTPLLKEALYSAVEARDLPGMADVDSSLLLFCKEIKKQGTVALSGECADEIFGGYPWYRDKAIRMTDGFPWAQSTAFRKSFLHDELGEEICPEDYVYARYQATLQDTDKILGLTDTESRMKEMMRLNLDWFMQTLLDRKDRMSMYNGLEVRVPFCDYRIAEYLYSVPWEFKDYNGYEKGLLREAMRGLLPEKVLWRKKSPYPKTHNPAYRKAVSEELQAVLENGDSPLFRFIKKEALEALLLSERQEPWYGQLMTTPQTIAYFLQIHHWLTKYKIKIRL